MGIDRLAGGIDRRHAAAGAAVGLLVVLGIALSPDAVLDRLRAVLYSPWFPLVLAGLYLLRPLLAWPITALSVLVGYRYGLALGVPLALAGAVATSLLPYAVARYAGTDGGLLGWARSGTERFFAATGDLRGVIAARLAPTPAEVISIAAGVGRVSVAAFVAGTAVGELPWTVAAVLAGHSMRRLSLSGVEAVDPAVAVGGAIAAILLLSGPAYRLFGDWLGRGRVTE
ncbi:MAG: TVP38/TMEM64 family protein [Halobacteriales archaeon]